MFRSYRAGSGSLSDVTVTSSVKVNELCESTGDVMNPNTRALDVRLWDVLNKYKAELVVSSSWWMKEMIRSLRRPATELNPAPHERRDAHGVNTANGRASKLTRFGRRDKSRHFWCERTFRSSTTHYDLSGSIDLSLCL